MQISKERDNLFNSFGLETLKDRYLLPNEEPQEMFLRVATAFGNDVEHSQRMYDYMSKHWFMPSTPVLANGGAKRGLPISCFLQSVSDDIGDIIGNWTETAWLSCKGGGIGVYYGNVRSIGERVGNVGETSGIIPFLKVNESLAQAISQGSLRRGSAAVYLPIWHGDIEEFIEVRRPTGGDPNRKVNGQALHHGVVIDDKFMEAVKKGTTYDLISPKNGAVIRSVQARQVWAKVLQTRLDVGEPYILFSDRLKESTPEWHRKEGLIPTQSNLCSEITLPTNEERTAVCCLGSVNLEYYSKFEGSQQFITDIMYFLDNVLQYFIDNAPDEMTKAKFSAEQERSVGLGAMGFHSMLQSKMVPFDSVMATVWNNKIFSWLGKATQDASAAIARDRGACPDAELHNYEERFSYKMAIAPNASISIITGCTSPGIEPYPANAYSHKTLSGTFTVKNKHLDKLIKEKYRDKYDILWGKIIDKGGSIQEVEGFTDEEKEVFKTAFEVDQRAIIQMAAKRQVHIDQAQSVNVFLPATIDKKSLHNLHYGAWDLGLKTLYYCRSLATSRAENTNLTIGNLDECVSCN